MGGGRWARVTSACWLAVSSPDAPRLIGCPPCCPFCPPFASPQDDPNARGVHAYLGTGILGLFVVHSALGLQLGLSL